MAVPAGAGGPDSDGQVGGFRKEEFLVKVLKPPNGIPREEMGVSSCAGDFAAGRFSACFASWLTSLRNKAADATGVEKPNFAVDGKTARRSHDHSKGLGSSPSR